MTMSQIQSMGIANFFLIGAFGIMASYYLEANPQMFQRYVLFMLHGALFLGIMAVSVASLQQLSWGSSAAQPPTVELRILRSPTTDSWAECSPTIKQP